MTVVELRPLSLGELLDRTFTLYRQHFSVFVGIAALPALVWYGQAFIIPTPNPLAGIIGPSRPAGPVGLVSGSAEFWTMILLFYAHLILYAASYAVAMAAATFAASDIQLGSRAAIGGSFRRALGRAGGLLDLVLSIGLRIVGAVFIGSLLVGMAAAILPRQWSSDILVLTLVGLGVVGLGFGLAIVLALGYAVAMPVMLLENVSARRAMKRSWAFTKGLRGRVFLVVALAFVVGYVAMIVFQSPFWVALAYAEEGTVTVFLEHASWFGGVAARALSGPLLMIGLVLLYFDLRVRKEGFDLKLMMDSLHPAAAPAPSSGGGPAVS